jgi:hypothetical protein
VLHILCCSPYRLTPLHFFPSLADLGSGQMIICTSTSLNTIAHALSEQPRLFSFRVYLVPVSFCVTAPPTMLPVVGYVVGSRPFPPAAHPVNFTRHSAEEVHAGRGGFWGLIHCSPSKCGANVRRCRGGICRVDVVEQVAFLGMSRKLRTSFPL